MAAVEPVGSDAAVDAANAVLVVLVHVILGAGGWEGDREFGFRGC